MPLQSVGRTPDLGADQRLRHFDDFAGGVALYVHLYQREVHLLLGSAVELQGVKVKVAGPHLRYLNGEFSLADEYGFGFVAVGLVDALDAPNSRDVFDEDAERFARTIETVGKLAAIGIGIVQWLRTAFQVGSLGHDGFFLDGQGKQQVSRDTPRKSVRSLILKITRTRNWPTLRFQCFEKLQKECCTNKN